MGRVNESTPLFYFQKNELKGEYPMSPLYQLLNQANTLVINRLLGHALGTNEAIIYACLISKYYYYADRNMLNGGWFYSTVPDLQESSTFTEKQQKRAVNNLVKAGLLRCELRGMPAKRSFYIIEDTELISSYIVKGKEIADKIKPKAAETYERKRQTSEATLPCSDQTAEQEAPFGQTLLRQKVGASSDEMAEHTINHNISNHQLNNPNQSSLPAAENKPDGIDTICIQSLDAALERFPAHQCRYRCQDRSELFRTFDAGNNFAGIFPRVPDNTGSSYAGSRKCAPARTQEKDQSSPRSVLIVEITTKRLKSDKIKIPRSHSTSGFTGKNKWLLLLDLN